MKYIYFKNLQEHIHNQTLEQFLNIETDKEYRLDQYINPDHVIKPLSIQDLIYLDAVMHRLPDINVKGVNGVFFEYPNLKMLLSHYIMHMIEHTNDIVEQALPYVQSPYLWSAMLTAHKSVWRHKWQNYSAQEKYQLIQHFNALIDIPSQRVAFTDKFYFESNRNAAYGVIKTCDKPLLSELLIIYCALQRDRGNQPNIGDQYEHFSIEIEEEYDVWHTELCLETMDDYFVSKNTSWTPSEEHYQLSLEKRQKANELLQLIGENYSLDTWFQYRYAELPQHADEITLMM